MSYLALVQKPKKTFTTRHKGHRDRIDQPPAKAGEIVSDWRRIKNKQKPRNSQEGLGNTVYGTSCILKSSPEGEGFSPRVRQ